MTSLVFSLLVALAPLAPVSPAASGVGISAEAPVARVEFRLKNDTGDKVRLHTGKGTSSINNGSSNRYTADEGQEFRLFDGSKGDLLFEVDSDMDGETLKLSDYM